jgi:hypothetical protein
MGEVLHALCGEKMGIIYENSRHFMENQDVRTSERVKLGFIHENSRNSSENHEITSPRPLRYIWDL